MTDEVETPEVQLAESTQAYAELLSHAVELAAGHRARARAAGFSEMVAEQMAWAAHAAFVHMVANRQHGPPAEITLEATETVEPVWRPLVRFVIILSISYTVGVLIMLAVRAVG